MQIEIRNVQYSVIASRETFCFTAVVYVDGKKAGKAENRGHGGSTIFNPQSLQRQLDEYAKTLPKLDGKYNRSGEGIINDLMADWLIARDTKRTMAKRIMFTVVGQNGVFQTKPMTKDQLAKALTDPAALKLRLKADQILNTMAIEEAVSILKQQSQ